MAFNFFVEENFISCLVRERQKTGEGVVELKVIKLERDRKSASVRLGRAKMMALVR